MRALIVILLSLIFALGANIFAYVLSEDYRFFIKKIKYREEVVYEGPVEVDDRQRIIIVENTGNLENPLSEGKQESFAKDEVTFLDVLSGEKSIENTKETIPEATSTEQEILEKFQSKFVLSDEKASLSLFDITTEYPDEYREYSNQHLSLYSFPTKNYTQVQGIFEVLSYEVPYTLNEVNNFGENSFYINLDDAYDDNLVRLVLEYENQAFGLKIKKDSYNIAKPILEELDSSNN